MTIPPFICRHCITQISQPSLKRLKLKPKRRLHTLASAVAAPVPAQKPTTSDAPATSATSATQWPAFPRTTFPEGTSPTSPTSPASPAASDSLRGASDSGSDVSTREEILDQWDGTLNKIFPPWRPPPAGVNAQNASSIAALKQTIIQNLGNPSGNYKDTLRQDFQRLYGFTRTEARHTVNQLERLTWGRQESKGRIPLDTFLSWKADHSRLLREIQAKAVHSASLAQKSKISQWAALTREDAAIMKVAWQRVDFNKRASYWPLMISSALISNPSVVPTFIQATFDPTWCPNYLLEDIVYLLFRAVQSYRPLAGGDDQLAELVVFLLETAPPQNLSLHQVVLQKTISVLSPDELVYFHESLNRANHLVRSNTLYHIISRLAKSPAHKALAANILCSMTKKPGFDINTTVPASICTSLLDLKEGDALPGGQAEPDKLFKLLLEHGLRPNLLSLTSLMRNFCLRGRLDTAWKIFDELLRRNFEPDPHVFSILFNASKECSDISSARTIIEIVSSHGAWSQYLVNDLLDFIYQENEAQPDKRRRQKKDNSAWRPMLQLYAKFYDLTPLRKFFPFPPENVIAGPCVAPRHATPMTDLAAALKPQPEHMLWTPSSFTMCQLIAAHVRSLAEPRAVIRQYNRIMTRLRNEEPVAVQLVAEQGTMLYDILIRGMMQFRETIHAPIRIVAHMMTRARLEKSRTGKNVRHPPPSIHTWTILLNGFKNHEHVQGALDVLDMMSRLGDIQPNLATWNALINAFARVGDADGAVRAMRLLERAGFHSDDRTVEAFSLLSRDRREQAVKLLEESRKESAFLPEPPRSPQSFLLSGSSKKGSPPIMEETKQANPYSYQGGSISTDKPIFLNPRPVPGPHETIGPHANAEFAAQLAEAQKRWVRHAIALKRRRETLFRGLR